MRAEKARRAVRGLLLAGSLLLTITSLSPAYAGDPPAPVSRFSLADPAVASTSDGFVAVATGERVKRATSPDASGPWTVTEASPLPADLPDWVKPGERGAWAPDLRRVDGTWVLYFSLLARGMGENQRCIGAATATSPTARFTYMPRPLVCPENDARDDVSGRPVPGAGVIDPSFFEAADGHRYLLYKTQQLPATLRIVRLDATGTKVRQGAESRELIQSDHTIIENPLMVQRPESYVLFASYRTYNTCRYQTIYLKAPTIQKAAFQDVPKKTLMTSGSTNLCGPGGADLGTAGDGGLRMFFHGWVCAGTTPCPDTYDDQSSNRGERPMYARRFEWDGASPRPGRFVRPSP